MKCVCTIGKKNKDDGVHGSCTFDETKKLGGSQSVFSDLQL